MAQNDKDKEHVNFIIEKEIRDEFTAITKKPELRQVWCCSCFVKEW